MLLLITGGAGFIGANLVQAALVQGHRVRVIDDLSTGFRSNLDGLDVELIEASILDPQALERATEGADAVVHLAALGSVPRSVANPVASHDANATGTLMVLEQARRSGVGHVVVASSSSVYGRNPALPKSEREWVAPMSPYAVTKLATEQYALAFQASYGMSTMAFRFFNVYGPLQRAGHVYAAVIPVFTDALLRGQALPVNGDGSQSRDFTYVGTVCRVLLDAVNRKVSHDSPVNLAFGSNTDLLTLTRKLGEAAGAEPTLEFRPARVGDVAHSQADNTVLRSLFPGVTPVSLEDGLAATVAWFRQEMGR